MYIWKKILGIKKWFHYMRIIITWIFLPSRWYVQFGVRKSFKENGKSLYSNDFCQRRISGSNRYTVCHKSADEWPPAVGKNCILSWKFGWIMPRIVDGAIPTRIVVFSSRLRSRAPVTERRRNKISLCVSLARAANLRESPEKGDHPPRNCALDESLIRCRPYG